MEEWKEIKDFEGYSVSNLGNVKNGNVSVCNYSLKSGQLYVKLSLNGKPYNRMIHKLVADAFIPNPKRFKYVAHKDGNLKNNNAKNLLWCNLTSKFKYEVKRIEPNQKSVTPCTSHTPTKIDALYLAIDIINKLPNLCDWSLNNFMILTKAIEEYLKD